MKIDQSNVLQVLFWGLVLYWVVIVMALTGSIPDDDDKKGPTVMSIIASSWCAGGAMLPLMRYAGPAIGLKWKTKRKFLAVLWIVWLVVTVLAVLFVTGVVIWHISGT